ncbi:hypothetical protein HID58_080911 [Brassica napus]|uniref:Uncharacterized protein n=2 Tax=Brassica TaxID=3705 RepID=A0A3P6FCZ7_BRAOL|nr:hypothetical protein HID58_080911 [Brassica napus]CAF2107998.1 unnamed protein product [Brassica napus]VDD55723.1 unnamed protein product [Brassica oleracea]
MKFDRFFVTKCTLDMNSVIVQSSEDLKKEIASLEFEILRIEQYLLSLYMASFDEQVTSFSPHNETSLVSQSDLTGVLSYHYQASLVSERSSSCPWSFQASLKAFFTNENTRYVYGHHTTPKDLLGSSHIVDDMENPSRFSEEILRCISSMYVTLSGRARTSSCLQASPSSKTRFDSWNPCLGDSKEANAPRGVVIESLKLHPDDSCFNIYELL